MCTESRDHFCFWIISDNISETAQDRDIIIPTHMMNKEITPAKKMVRQCTL